MGKRKPTPEQEAAILAEGEILVSASAGSGKTYVMVEKLIRLILEGKTDVPSVLAVTFTKLAAAEIKERLRDALEEGINELSDPQARRRLKEQALDVATADISTVHSFCTNVIRRYFYETDVAGNFRVADEKEATRLQERAVQSTFDALLKEKNEPFSLLCRVYGNGRGLKGLQTQLLDFYKKVLVRDDYAEFLRGTKDRYTEEGFRRACCEFRAFADRAARKTLELYREVSAELAARTDGLFTDKHTAFAEEIRAVAQSFLDEPNLFTAVKIAQTKFSRKPSNAKINKSDDASAILLDRKIAELKNTAGYICESLGELDEEEIERQKFFRSGELAVAMSELALRFDVEYSLLKRRAGVLDFSDLEHKCLELLRVPHVCEAVRSRYDYVFIDEYQDVNPVQEHILSLVSGKNVFMVGDAKQSIYGFRGCSASFFTEKFQRLSGQNRALTLNGNFRSCANVIDAVNNLFSQAMTVESGSVDYKKTACMTIATQLQLGGEVYTEYVPPREKKEPEMRSVYSVKEHMLGDEREVSAEGAMIADLVLSEKKQTHKEGGKDVPTKYGDIVILTRKKNGNAPEIVRELVRRGVPVATAAEVNICEYEEIKRMIALLRFLDNGEQDIPLASALKSPLGNCTDSDLANIRLAAEYDDTFCTAFRRYAQREDALAEKLRAFSERCEQLRLEMNVKSAAEMINRILSMTEMEAEILSHPCGAEKMRRINRLCAACGDASVEQFLNDFDNGDGKIGLAESGGEGAVRVMTIHNSKGLEFPVIIVAGLNALFNSDDIKKADYDDEWGFTPKAFDTERFIQAETVIRGTVKKRMMHKRTEDEMRLLYVALTRAKSKLHLVFTARKDEDCDSLKEATCFADFFSVDFLESIPEKTVFSQQVEPPKSRVPDTDNVDEQSKAEIAAHYCKEYPYQASVGLPVKTSASALLQLYRAEREEEKQAVYVSDGTEDWRAQEEFYGGATDAQTGTAYHAFLEEADFSADVQSETDRVCNLLQERGFTQLKREKCVQILQLPLFERLRGYTLFREREFICSLAAADLYGGSCQDEILVQGVIDLMATRGDECVLVDYKYSSHDRERLLADYTPQLKLYAKAVRKTGAYRTISAYIFNIMKGFVVPVPLDEN